MKCVTPIVGFFGAVLVTLVLSAAPARGGKMLFLLPLASRSHRNVFEPLIQEMARRGHQVTAVSPWPGKNAAVREISSASEAMSEMLQVFKNPVETRAEGKWKQMNMGPEKFIAACRSTYENPEFMALLNETRFDVVFVDTILNDCMLGFVYRLGAPLVQWTTFAAGNYLTSTIGNRLPPSYVPNPFFNMPSRMTFFERCLNVAMNLIVDFMIGKWEEPMWEMQREYLGEGLPSWFEINANMSMLFMNSHFSLTNQRPVLPDVLEVGGMHCRPATNLSKDLDDFVSGATEGLVLFSLGSIVQGTQLPDHTRKVFLNAFGRLKQRVLWKWETEQMPEKLPANVKLTKWVPQQDVLGHPNTKVFISHGGLLSLQESVYHATPMIMVPIFGDQDTNAARAKSMGISETVEVLDVTEDGLVETINKILSDSSYAEKAQELSAFYRDQPETPLQRGAFWAEYIMRHKGAKHLRSPARDLNFFQYFCLDVAAFFAAIALVILWIIKVVVMKLISFVMRRFRSAKQKVQ